MEDVHITVLSSCCRATWLNKVDCMTSLTCLLFFPSSTLSVLKLEQTLTPDKGHTHIGSIQDFSLLAFLAFNYFPSIARKAKITLHYNLLKNCNEMWSIIFGTRSQRFKSVSRVLGCGTELCKPTSLIKESSFVLLQRRVVSHFTGRAVLVVLQKKIAICKIPAKFPT